MKKRSIVISVVFAVATSVAAFAIELPADVTDIPSSYATVSNGKVKFASDCRAYPSSVFNAVLESYGLELTAENAAAVPSTYAKVKDGTVSFNTTAMAYSPMKYHKILTAYGLELTPEGAATIEGTKNYCQVLNGKIVFGKSAMAYSGSKWNQILSAYTLPVTPVVVVEVDCIDSDGDTVCDEIDVCPGTPKGVEVDERGCWVLEQTYLFDFDKAELKPEFMPLLDHVARIVNDNPKMNLQIEGHTDSIGTEEYNQKLSERRADAIKKALVSTYKIEPMRLKSKGFGETKPIASNTTAEGRAKNRRVELTPLW
ncbi:OmpA family protein [Desulfogranum marinum]|uniref:OmpA family protein n=1 Tax=Desulfogranum marinum TaxID=453220 RepID=UPI0029C8631E|nr:OmpA family protein [Desulfogranum marinum]